MESQHPARVRTDDRMLIQKAAIRLRQAQASTSSAGRLWTPGLLWHPPVDAFEQITKLRGRDGHRTISRRRPQEVTTFQPLGEQAHALSIMPQDLDQTAAPATECEQMPAVWIALERLLYQQR